jgi:hypothetical protein
MLKLNLKNKPYNIDLMAGVSVTVIPMTSSMMLELLDGANRETDGQGENSVDFAKRVGARVIIGWSGVVDADGQTEAPVTPEYVGALMDVFPAYSSFHSQYVAPSFRLAEEGNGSSSSPNGTTAGAGNTAKGARGSAKTARGKKSR